MATLNNMYARTVTITEREYERRTKELLGEYQKAYKATTEHLKATYLKTLSGVGTENYYNEMLKYGRYKALLDAINTSYINAARRAGQMQVNNSTLAMSNNFYLRQYVLDWVDFDNRLTSFLVLPSELINQAVIGQPEAWTELTANIRNNIEKQYGSIANYTPQAGTLTDTLLANRTRDLTKLRGTLAQIFVQGKSYTQAASLMRDVLNTSANNALRIARTEGNRLMNAGSFALTQRARAQGIQIVRQWDATLDARTRGRHAALDGKKEDKDGLFYIGDDSAPYPGQFGQAANSINCRCGILDIVDGVQPEVRTGRNPLTGEYEEMSFRDFDAWAKDNNMHYVNGALKPRSN